MEAKKSPTLPVRLQRRIEMIYKPIIAIPFYNHLDLFKSVAERLKKYANFVLLVNDGSCDNETKGVEEICKKYGFMYLKLQKNSGKGGAVMAALKYAKEHGYSHLLQVDADGQHDYEDIEKFLRISKDNPTYLICGAPVYDNSAPKSRLYGRKITKFWVSIETFSTKIDDTMCGFRVYPVLSVSKILPILYFKRMGFDIEILVKSFLNGIQIINVPTKVFYPKEGISHFKGFKDNFEISLMHATLCCYALYRCIFKRATNV